MRFGYFVSYARADSAESFQQVLRDTIEQVECAEAAGFDIVWFPERHFNSAGSSPHPLISIADAARATKRIRLGTSVIIAPYRHPLVLAEEIGLVDQLTEGRLEVGFARGASSYQYERFGLNDTEAAGRLTECMDILLGLWGADEEFSFKGKYFDFPDTYISPRPFQAPHPPISLAARSPDSLRYCLRHGLAIHTTPLRQPKSASVTTMKTISAIAEEHPDLSWPDVAIEMETFVSESPEAVMDAMRHLEASHIRTQNFGRNGRMPWKGFGTLDPLPEGLQITAEQLVERCVVGDPAAVLHQVKDYQDMGLSEFIANMDFGQSQRAILKSIELFGSKIIAQDWSVNAAHSFQRGERGNSAQQRQALRSHYDARFGPDWQEWREAEWIDWFEKRRSDTASQQAEIFDPSLNPKNVRAEATGIVQPSGKLCLLRDLPCPECGRPSLVLSYRPNGESPQQLRAAAVDLPTWKTWHETHP